MKTDIFRKSALARMSSPEQLDQLLQVTTAKSWIALAGVSFILATAVAWGFKGRLPTKTEGKGVVLRTGTLLTVGTLSSGQVATLSVHVGDHVKSGEMIATVGQPSIVDKIREAQEQLNDAVEEGEREKIVRAEGLKLEMASLERQRQNFEQQIESYQQQEKIVSDQIPENEELYAKGLVTKQQVLSLRERVATMENNISNLRSQILEANSTEYKTQNSNAKADLDIKSHIEEMRRNLRLLRSDLGFQTKVDSPYSGRVVELQATPGNLVGPGNTILTLEPENRDLEVVAYISASKSKEVKPGMEVDVMPSSVRPEEYGFIRGVVTTVADYPSTDASLMRVFQNNSVAQSLSSGGPVTEVHVEIKKKPGTFSGYEWSSGNGAPVLITPGTPCSVQVITREQAPITMVFPYLKSKLGIY